MKDKVIFGAGELGCKAIRKYGANEILTVIDNDQRKIGTIFEGFTVISLAEFLKSWKGNENIVICATWKHTEEISKQLLSRGIDNFSVFSFQLFEDVDLLFNQYETFEGISEQVWNNKIIEGEDRKLVRKFVNENMTEVPLFHEIEIETINRCNGGCSFCPVNVQNDIRTEKLMDENLFYKIINELKEIRYAGRIALFSNNEPLLDKRIVVFSRYVRENLPNAQIHLFTNGTLLSIDLFAKLIPYLDELIIDNYNQQLELIPTVKAIKEYIESMENDLLRKKVKILLRKPNEILSSRGGDAPNRNTIIDVHSETCALPYCQMVVRPSGKVSLCCNDPYGKMTLGDLNEEHILDIWYGDKYKQVREMLSGGRGMLEHCKNCDTFMII